MEARLERGLKVLEEIKRKRKISRQIFLGKSRGDFGHALPLCGARGDQARVGAGNARDQQIAKVARQLAREMLEVVAVALELVDHVEHAARIAGGEQIGRASCRERG